MRSISEVKDYLKKYQVNDNDIIDILNRLKDLKLVDDNMLANLILESTINNHKGPNIFIQKVKQRKLDININEFVYEKDIEEEVIDKVIKKYLDNNKELPIKKQKEKIYTKLLRDGFSNDLISKCINKVTFLDNSYLSLEKDINKALFKYRNLDLKEKKEKVLSNLMRKGYSYSQIVSKINSIDNQD